MSIAKHLEEFALVAYKDHGASHDFQHARRVLANAQEIITGEALELTPEQLEMLPYVMIGHDFRDHKYVALGVCLSEEEIYNFYTKHLGKKCAREIIHIHENCSWSKRHTSQAPEGGNEILRKLLQDSDWLEAIGEIGLQRCIDYTKEMHSVAVEADVCKHIKEKLLLIPDELHFATSRKMAVEKTPPLYVYLAAHSK